METSEFCFGEVIAEMLNRCVITIKAREPFLEWLKGLPDPGNFTLDEVNSDTTAYLLPAYEDDRKRGRLLNRYFRLIFEEQLSGWWIDERDWPSNRDLRIFKRWFEIEFHAIVLDLVNGPLLDDE